MHDRFGFFTKLQRNVVADSHYIFCVFRDKTVLTIVEVGNQAVACERAEVLGIAFAVFVFKASSCVLPGVKRRYRIAEFVGIENTVHLVGNANRPGVVIAELFDDCKDDFGYSFGRLNPLVFSVRFDERIIVYAYGIENFTAFAVDGDSAYSRCSYVNSE